MYYLVWKDTYTEKTNIRRFNSIEEAKKEISKPAYIEREWYLFTYDKNDNLQIVLSNKIMDFGKTPFEMILERVVETMPVIFIITILIIIFIYIMTL